MVDALIDTGDLSLLSMHEYERSGLPEFTGCKVQFKGRVLH